MAVGEQETLDESGLPTRFRLLSRIGSGGFGVVYEAMDDERQARVALKYLTHLGPDALYRFKREFRSLSDISHPNVVQLYDLLAHDDRWFLTMELVEGAPLPRALGYEGFTAISGTGPDIDMDRCRHLFHQIATGVQAIHSAGRLHRDLKCTNVRVTDDDRAVVLDFGLVSEPRTQGAAQQQDIPPSGILGTPLYMAPEQCAGAPLDENADWYALGTMLFRALTGRYPFEGHLYEVLHAKQARDAPPPREHAPVLPEDLAELCERLLARDPLQRPRAAETLSVLGREPAVEPEARDSSPAFVGRRRELRKLERAFDDAREAPTAVMVHGPSGMGKSALVRQFVRARIGRRRTTVVLEGRCYARETLPYKALDGVVDALGRYLLSLSRHECAAMVPRHVSDLVELFPVLQRVQVFEEEATGVGSIPDPQERRRRAFLALRELLGRISDRRPLVLYVDDLQWGDAASAEVLANLLQAPDAPAMMLVGVYRSEEAATSEFLRAFARREETDQLTAQRLEVAELSETEAGTLARKRLAEGSPDALAEHVARESGGNPLFIDLMSRHVRDGDMAPSAEERVSLSDVVQARLDGVPEEGQRFLELLAVSGQPVPTSVSADALGSRQSTPGLLRTLSAARLIRTRTTDGVEEVECYHDRIRETVVSSLSSERESAHHASLADAHLAGGDADPQVVAAHLAACNRRREAFRHAKEAARRAGETLAFARAARLYEWALELWEGAERDVLELRIALGDAHKNAGHGADAAHAYLAAADHARAGRALDLRRQAAEQLLFSGHLDEGRSLLGDVLRGVGLRLPDGPVGALASFAGRRAQVRLRGMRFTERAAGEIATETLLKIDTCWSVAIGLSMIDPIRAGSFQALHLLLALDAGDVARIAKAVAVEIPFCATAGAKNRPKTERYELLASELAERVEDPFVQALLASCIGGAAWLEGRWEPALEGQERADEILRRECRGASWQLATTNIVMGDALYRLGRWSALFDRHNAMVEDARARGDLFLEIYLRTKFVSLAHLASDAPDAALRELESSIERWTKEEFHLLHFWNAYHRCEADLYRGEPDAAAETLAETWPQVKRALLTQLQMYRVSLWDLSGRIAVARAKRAAGRERSKLLAEARATVKRLRKEKTPFARTVGAVLAGAVAATAGDRSAAVDHLTGARRAADESGMALVGAAADLRRAALAEDGAEMLASAEERMRAERIVSPGRMADVLAPGAF